MRPHRFAVWVNQRHDYLRVFGRVHDWPTAERARTLLQTERLIESYDPRVPGSAYVAYYYPEPTPYDRSSP